MRHTNGHTVRVVIEKSISLSLSLSLSLFLSPPPSLSPPLSLSRLINSCHSLLTTPRLKLSSHVTLLSVYKVLLNLTHDNELGAHRVGEQKGIMDILLDSIFQVDGVRV